MAVITRNCKKTKYHLFRWDDRIVLFSTSIFVSIVRDKLMRVRSARGYLPTQNPYQPPFNFSKPLKINYSVFSFRTQTDVSQLIITFFTGSYFLIFIRLRLPIGIWSILLYFIYYSLRLCPLPVKTFLYCALS